MSRTETVTVSKPRLLKRQSSDAEKEEKVRALKEAAGAYVLADKQLESACGDHSDPIACTVFALKKRNIEVLPKESFAAADCLAKVVALHSELVQTFKMDTDEVRQIWFPIMNAGYPVAPSNVSILEANLNGISLSQKKHSPCLVGARGILPADLDMEAQPFEVIFDDTVDSSVVIAPVGANNAIVRDESLTLPRVIVLELLEVPKMTN